MNAVQPMVQNIRVVDISRVQIQFASHTWQNWHGRDWGDWTWQFINDNAVRHFQLDRTDFSALEMLHFKKQRTFVDYVNQKFYSVLQAHGYTLKSFEQAWQIARTKQAEFINQNIVHWTLHNKDDLIGCKLWPSNVVDYKWTMLNTMVSETKLFQDLVDEISDQ
jgi:hypothetical protein